MQDPRYRAYRVEDREHSTPCWIWSGGIASEGYGKLTVNYRTTLAHRWFYEAHVGPIPAGLQLDHLCRVRSCVNPDHLEPVTSATNLRRGDRTKLTEAQVREIKHRIARGDPQVRVAQQFNVSPQLINAIKKGRAWADV